MLHPQHLQAGREELSPTTCPVTSTYVMPWVYMHKHTQISKWNILSKEITIHSLLYVRLKTVRSYFDRKTGDGQPGLRKVSLQTSWDQVPVLSGLQPELPPGGCQVPQYLLVEYEQLQGEMCKKGSGKGKVHTRNRPTEMVLLNVISWPSLPESTTQFVWPEWIVLIISTCCEA